MDRVVDRLDTAGNAAVPQAAPRGAARLLRLKRLVSSLRKTLMLEREVLARLIRGEFALVEDREIAYYRNVYDHLVRYTELDRSRPGRWSSDLMQTPPGGRVQPAQRIMKVLTMISTIGMVCAVVAGIYGMNFKHMPELEWEYGYPMALGIMAAAAAACVGFFRWKKWV